MLLCTLPPPELASTDVPYSNTRLHSERGWCWFERAASMVLKNTECLLDLSMYCGALEWGHGGSHAMGQTTCCGQMKSERQPPVAPDAFGATMRERVASGELRFTARADMEAVIAQFALGFEVAFDGLGNSGTVMSVGYINLGWGDDEGRQLLRALEYASTHCRFPFGPIPILLEQGNRYSAEMLGLLPAVGSVQFRGVRYGQRGATARPPCGLVGSHDYDSGARSARESISSAGARSARESISSDVSDDLEPISADLHRSPSIFAENVSLRQGLASSVCEPVDGSVYRGQEQHGADGGDDGMMAQAALVEGGGGTVFRTNDGRLAFVRIN